MHKEGFRKQRAAAKRFVSCLTETDGVRRIDAGFESERRRRRRHVVLPVCRPAGQPSASPMHTRIRSLMCAARITVVILMVVMDLNQMRSRQKTTPRPAVE